MARSSRARTLEDLTLDSGYGGAAESFRSSSVSLCVSEPAGGCRWPLSDSSLETVPTLLAEDAGTGSGSCAALTELEELPWSLEDVAAAALSREQEAPIPDSPPQDVLLRLSLLLSRALLRIAREAQRLSQRYQSCSRYEVQSSVRMTLSWSMSACCLSAALTALSLYNMSQEEQRFSRGKSERCGLVFSVGRFFCWMVDSRVAVRIHEHAAIYLAACMENLLRQVLQRAQRRDGESSWVTVESLEQALSGDPEIWGCLLPWSHLTCGKNAGGK